MKIIQAFVITQAIAIPMLIMAYLILPTIATGLTLTILPLTILQPLLIATIILAFLATTFSIILLRSDKIHAFRSFWELTEYEAALNQTTPENSDKQISSPTNKKALASLAFFIFFLMTAPVWVYLHQLYIALAWVGVGWLCFYLAIRSKESVADEKTESKN
jgi:hypothetical protein